jgi:CheY-like chemotaxis protein
MSFAFLIVFFYLLINQPSLIQHTVPYILFVDDDEEDRELILEAFERLDFHQIQVLPDADQLLEHLKKRPTTQYPSLIVLDSNLPRLGGESTLMVLKKDPRLESIPVMVLSSLMNSQKKETLLNLGACRAEEKPATITAFDQLMKELIAQVK